MLRSTAGATKRRTLSTLLSVTVIGISLTAPFTGAEARRSHTRAHAETCHSFGIPYGTPAWADCMLTQQSRRDAKRLESLERTRLTTEIAKNAQIMSDRARRQRCDRNPDRRECRPR